MRDRPVTVVLDCSAIVAYTLRSIDVGETLGEVADGQSAAALPLPCLIEAITESGNSPMLDVLAGLEHTVVVDGDPESWRWLYQAIGLTGSYESATAAVFALDANVPILSARRDRYQRIGGDDEDLVIDVRPDEPTTE